MGRCHDRGDPNPLPQKPLGLWHPLRFKSRTGKLCFAVFSYARIAQLAEQLICNQQVVGSNPTAGSILCCPRAAESVIEVFRRRVSKIWDLDDLGRRVRFSQKNRMVVRDAMKEGQLVNWDFSSTTDYSDLYVRSSNSHEVVDRKVRIKAKGYQLPIPSAAK